MIPVRKEHIKKGPIFAGRVLNEILEYSVKILAAFTSRLGIF